VARPGLTGVLLVGGASSRFGSPKALAELEGETLADRAWRTLGEACDERLALGKAEDRLELPFPVLDDVSEVRAPLAGIVAGLRAARHEVAVFLPVDVPFASADLLRSLGAACREAAVTESGPLPVALAREALPVLERRLSSNELRLGDALLELDTAFVDADPALLVNVNRPADLAAIRRYGLASASSGPGASTRSRSAPVPTSDTVTSSSRSTNST
jgi:molybdenum cofactor guanylyltransferase